jgi:hypothetical protein
LKIHCPDCGTEVRGADICSRCGKHLEITQQRVEVEYKEFTLSEFLEIRKKQDARDKDTGGSPDDTEQGRFLDKRRPLSRRETGMSGLQTKKGKDETRVFLTVILALFIGVLILGAFFLLKFLFQS